MPPPRPRVVAYTPGAAAARPTQSTPMSERQQMALLIQMTSTSSDAPRTPLKKNDSKKSEDVEETFQNEKSEQKDSKESVGSDEGESDTKKEAIAADCVSSYDTASKRSFSDIEEDEFEECDDIKRKKRKDSESSKEKLSNTRIPQRTEKNLKQSYTKSVAASNKSSTSEKEQSDSMKANRMSDNDNEEDSSKMSDNLHGSELKVPPLKIVIPQQNCTMDTDGSVSRTGKLNITRNSGLPYVVSSSNESTERESISQSNSPHESPVKVNSSCVDDKSMKFLTEEKNLHRVLRSSHRSGVSNVERSSNNSSPQMQSNSPSPSSLNINEMVEGKVSFVGFSMGSMPQNSNFDNDQIVNLPSPSTSSTSSLKEAQTQNVDLHPRKRKIRTKNDDRENNNGLKINSGSNSNTEVPTHVVETHSHDLPFINCFQMYINIRRQIESKWKNLYVVKPRPPQGFNDYLLNKKTYLLSSGGGEVSDTVPPATISTKMRNIFQIQEKERNDLRMRHTVEREKLCLNAEQEIIRVHSKAARNISCQSVPLSVCTFLKEEEVYNLLTPEQEEKDKSARCRFNGRLLLSWLKDVDDKWEKIKESMVLRHHNEAESLHAVQLMDWEIALKKYEQCDLNKYLYIQQDHVPIVHVSDDFDLLPA